MIIDEKKDIELFENIAEKYARKDIYKVSREARKFQLKSLISLIDREDLGFIVDLGCGPGFNADYLKDRYNEYLGVDYSKEFIAISKSIHKDQLFIQGNIKDLSKIINKVPDVILGVGVLHHIDRLDLALKSIREISSEKTILAFIEPSKGNPLVQLLRSIRKRIDKEYSEDQIFFSNDEIKKIFEKNGFFIDKIQFQGYLSTPFAQVILKPSFLFYPLCKMAIFVDKIIERSFNNRFSWNIIFTAMVK